MATDMQSFLNGLLHTANHSIYGARDRHASASPGSANHRFESMVESARPRSTEPGQKPIAARHQQAAHPRTASHTSSQTENPSRTAETFRQEKSVTHTERTQSEKPDDFNEHQDEESIETHGTSGQPTGLSTDMLLTAGLTMPASAEGRGAEATSPSTDTAPADEATVEGLSSVQAPGSQALEPLSTKAPSESTSAIAPDPVSGHLTSDGVRNVEAPSTAGPTKEPVGLDSIDNRAEAAPLTGITHKTATGETPAAAMDGSLTPPHSEPVPANSASTLTVSHMMPKPAADAAAANQSEFQSPFDAVIQTNDMTAGQSTSRAGQFLSQDQQPSSESRSGSDHAKSALPSSDDKTLRPQFLDQATGISPSAPPSGDSRVGRAETGQAAMAHVSKSERINELRGAFPSTQTVTLDLDPLDMGPLRVRIMMSEQTVHAHIRTEHGELGQSLLQQGPSLEASLRTTGLEMGMLRVTVDQQQQGRGESAWAFQQQQGRPGPASGGPAASVEEERAIRAGQDLYIHGRVSFFA